MEFLYTLAIIFGIFGISFILLNIGQIFTGKQFKGTCASNNPALKNDDGGCGYCGRTPDGSCETKTKKKFSIWMD